MSNPSLKYDHFHEAHNDAIAGWLDQWAWLKNSSHHPTWDELFYAYKNYWTTGRDFFWMHWQVNTDDLDRVLWHIESPPYDGADPQLNRLKREIIRALLSSDIPELVQGKGYIYELGKKITNKDIGEDKSTTVFRIVLTGKRHKPTPEEDIQQIHDAVGSEVDSVLQQFLSRLKSYFRP